ncbi:MAG: hypothetical protein DMG89_15660 [Acidobacteria bacterium]|nr:MAG: hypothetical protein DMG89_15660 [Acidobacteriota bacterium]
MGSFTGRQRSLRTVVATLRLGFLIACPMWVLAQTGFDSKACRIEGTHTVLCFNLKDDSNPRAGVVLTIDSPTNKESLLFLPFETKSSDPDPTLLSTWGSYEGFTLVSFVEVNGGSHVIGLDPVFESYADDDDLAPKSSLYFRRRGLERLFVYQHSVQSRQSNFSEQIRNLASRPIDVVGIVRPKDAKGLELRDGRTENPAAFLSREQSRFYHANDEGGNGSKIEVKYALQPTPLQKQALLYSGKLAGALIAPIIAILFLSAKENVRPTTRRIVLWILGLVQLVFCCYLVYTAWSIRGETGTSGILDWAMALISAVTAGLPLWLKRDAQLKELALRP